MPHQQSNHSNSISMCKSSFTFTFALEVVGNEVWNDFTDGWLELEQPIQTLKLTYLLYPGHPHYELNISVWPYCAKITYNGNICWLRTWLFLDRRWLTFSISHLFTARVGQLLPFTVTLQPENSPPLKGTQDHKADHAHHQQAVTVYIPPVTFSEQRYFAPVLLPHEEEEETMGDYVANMIYGIINSFVPLTVYDGIFEQPHPVSDVRHRDAIIYNVRELILNKKISTLYEPPLIESSDSSQSPRGYKENKQKTGKLSKEKQGKKQSKEKELKKQKHSEKDKKEKENGPKTSTKYELNITGNDILAGAGRIIKFNVQNEIERPQELGEVVALLSTKNLPAPDDTPIFFVNVERLSQIPVHELEKARINDLRTVWRFGGIEHCSQRHVYQSGNADFCDHQAVLLFPEIASELVSSFLDNPFEIEIHGFQNSVKKEEPTLFGYNPNDIEFNTKIRPLKLKEETNDVIVAVCKIDLHPLAIRNNGLIRGEFSLEAPTTSFAPLDREDLCTNDFNAIKCTLVPELVVQPYVILESLMSLDVSIGLVGCKPQDASKSYSRFFCIIKESVHVMALLTEITEANDYLVSLEKKDDLITGFVLDTGSEVFVYLEGPRDGQILRIWELTEDFYPSVRPVFSTSSKYATRVYSDLLAASVPVSIMKMYAPLNSLLACPPLYTKPGAPLPARAAALKIGRIIAGKLYYPPSGSEMPTILEMQSFRLEFCSPPKLISTWPDQNIKLIPSVPSGRLLRKLSITLPQKHGNTFDKK